MDTLVLLPVALAVIALFVVGILVSLIYLARKGLLLPTVGVCVTITFILAAMGFNSFVMQRPPEYEGRQRSQSVAQNGSGVDEVRDATSGDREKSPQTVTMFPTFPWTITGEGKWEITSDKAIEGALKDAQEKIVAQYEAQRRPLSWTPPLSYIRKHLVKTEPIIEKKEIEPAGEWMRARVMLEISASDSEEIERLASKYRAEQRKAVAESRVRGLARYFACLVAGLATIAVYSQLQQSTKGRYTWLLRLTAVGFVVVVVAVLLRIK